MLDPFPIPPSALLTSLIEPFAAYTGLSTLPLHIHEVLLSALGYAFIQAYVSPALSGFLFPSTYPKLNRRTRVTWDVHVVSFIQSVWVCVLALWVMRVDQERASMSWEQRVWGYTGALGLVQACACGYFVWDLWVSARYLSMFGWGMLAHAVSALTVYAFGFRPFINFYAPTFILYELSSPFLNIHWFLDKLNQTGSNLQLANGILLLTSFFGCRLVWGTYSSLAVFYDVLRAVRYGAIVTTSQNHGFVSTESSMVPESEIMRFATGQDIPLWLALAYLGSNVVLNGLNWYWFGKMIEAIRKRFDPPLGTRGLEPKMKSRKIKEGIDGTVGEENGELIKVQTDVARGLYADGHKSVEVDRIEVRKRNVKVEENGEEVEFVP